MKIIFADFRITKYGGIMAFMESKIKALQDLGHEVEVVQFSFGKDASNKRYLTKLKQLEAGTYETEALKDPHSDNCGYAKSPITGLWFNTYKGYLLEPGKNLIPAYHHDALQMWYDKVDQADAIFWNFMPTKQKEAKGFSDWTKFFDLSTEKIKQVFVVHDAKFPEATPWLAALEDKIHYVEAAHLPAYTSMNEFSIPTAPIYNSRDLPYEMEELPKFSERDADIFSAQVFKPIKRVEDLLRAIPYMKKDTTKFIAGVGIEWNFMANTDLVFEKANVPKGKSFKYITCRKNDPDLPEGLDMKSSIWDRAKEFGMEHLYQISVDDVQAWLQSSKIVVDASWDANYAKRCNTHINGIVIEAMLNGSYPVLRDYRGCKGKRFEGEDKIFNEIDALIIPWNATPKQMGEAIQAKLDSFTDESYLKAVKHNYDVILKKYFDGERNALKSVEYLNMSRSEVRQALKVGETSDRVLEETDKIMTEFFGAEFPVNWITD